jgi:hypothetical protein
MSQKELLIELTSTKFFNLLYFVPLYILVFLGSSENFQKDHPTAAQHFVCSHVKCLLLLAC